MRRAQLRVFVTANIRFSEKGGRDDGGSAEADPLKPDILQHLLASRAIRAVVRRDRSVQADFNSTVELLGTSTRKGNVQIGQPTSVWTTTEISLRRCDIELRQERLDDATWNSSMSTVICVAV
jgi:hypothetical protein